MKEQNTMKIKQLKSYLKSNNKVKDFNLLVIKFFIKFYEVCKTKKFSRIFVYYNKERHIIELRLFVKKDKYIIFTFLNTYIEYYVTSFSNSFILTNIVSYNLNEVIQILNNLCEKFSIKGKGILPKVKPQYIREIF